MPLSHHVTRAEKDRYSWWLITWWFPETWKALLEWLRQHPGSCKSIRTKRERRESDREEGWGIRFTIYPGGGGPGTMVSVLLQPVCAWHGGRKLSCWERMPLWPDLFCVPPILTWESFCDRCPNGFYVSDLCPHNTGWYSPQLEKRQRRDPHPFKRQLLWVQWAVGRLEYTRVGNPGQHSSIATRAVACWQRVPMRNEKRGGGEETPSPWTSHQKCHGLGAGWKRIFRHETIRVWFFGFCILRPSLVLSALHSLGNHNLGRKNHFNYLVYTLYLWLFLSESWKCKRSN